MNGTSIREVNLAPVNLGQVARGAAAEWLPAPRPVRKVSQTAATAFARPAGLWLQSESEATTEKIVLLVLVVAAILSIGYGFSSLLDLVQHWAVFQGGVAQLIR